MLVEAGVLREPLLYLSLYFRARRSEYYRLLNAVRFEGDWEAWLEFFLTGVAETAEAAVVTAQSLLEMFREHEALAATISPTAARVYVALRAMVAARVADLAAAAAVSPPTAAKAVEAFVKAGIARELTGRKRNRLFVYDRYLKIMSEGADPGADRVSR
jgi:Fic family protein